jgi:alkanesulfonate monooxygenase SsuD/methylene tetrahydromethanopterin reductase-like flavin-dependent oxidoreductase (luciferase family)
MEQYWALLGEHGHDASQVRNMFVFFLFIDEDYATAVAEGREVTARYMQLLIDQFPSPPAGSSPQPDPFARFRAFPDEIEQRAVVGTPADCRKKIEELGREFGIDQMVFYLHAGARNIGRARAALELFAREVAPYFRETRSN